jgi:CheY-like chemotaxis protein
MSLHSTSTNTNQKTGFSLPKNPFCSDDQWVHIGYADHARNDHFEIHGFASEYWSSDMEKKLRLMIVDDNARTRGALAALASTLDWLNVTGEASNGEDAIEKVKLQLPDMVLMDVEMPVMDGLEATQIIKKNWPQVKVIVLTLYPDYCSQARKAGADAFLVKGCSMEEMTSTIRSLQPAQPTSGGYDPVSPHFA